MFDRILKRMRERIRARQYVMTLHAEEEMESDGMTTFDIEKAILTGGIIERQRDKDTGEWKYLIKGQAFAGSDIVAVTKLSPTGKLVIITVYME